MRMRLLVSLLLLAALLPAQDTRPQVSGTPGSVVWLGDVATTSTPEEELGEWILPANTITKNGAGLRVTAWWTLAAGVSSKVPRLRFGTSSSGGNQCALRTISTDAGTAVFFVNIVRVSATDVVCSGALHCTSCGTASTLNGAYAGGADFAATQYVRFTCSNAVTGECHLSGYVIEPIQ